MPRPGTDHQLVGGDAFHLGDYYAGAYRTGLNANLAFWDGLDEKQHWPIGEDGSHPLTDLVLADYLVVDVTKVRVPDASRNGSVSWPK